jgi:hypothetical protein
VRDADRRTHALRKHRGGQGFAGPAAVPADLPFVTGQVGDPRQSSAPAAAHHLRAKKYTKPVLKGDLEAVGIVWQSVKESMQGVLP